MPGEKDQNTEDLKVEDKKPDTPTVDPKAIEEATRKAVLGEVGAQLKELFGVDSFDALKSKKLEEEGRHKELADAKGKEALEWKTKHDRLLIESQVKSAALQLNAIDPDTVSDLTSSKAVLNADGSVSIEGKPLSAYLEAFLKGKPYLVKAADGSGSGAGAGGGSQVAEVEALKVKLADAKKRGNVQEVLKLKRELAAKEKK